MRLIKDIASESNPIPMDGFYLSGDQLFFVSDEVPWILELSSMISVPLVPDARISA